MPTSVLTEACMASLTYSPVEDIERLDALARYDILDTAPEETFDNIVAVAKALCHAPVALISLVDRHRQWFKAHAGFEGTETPLDQSICVHAMALRKLLVIPDLTKDDRTSANTLVSGGPEIRFYAGAPLLTPDGHMLGTLCVLDLSPRAEGLTGEQASGLEALARHAVMLMELRRILGTQGKALAEARQVSKAVLDRAQASEEAVERLRQEAASAVAAQEAGRIGTFDVDLATDVVRTSPQFCRIYGLPESNTYPASRIEPLAVDAGETVLSSDNGSASPAADYRIRRASDGAMRWLSRRGEFVRDGAGRPLNFVGTVHDITERRSSELYQAALLALSDRTRDASSTGEVIGAAAEVLGQALDAARVGYAEMDLVAATFTVERDWTAPGVASIMGRHSLNPESKALIRLKAGTMVTADHAGEVDWLFLDLPVELGPSTEAQIKVPLTRRGDLVGVLFVHSATARKWSREELDFTAALADRTYTVIARVQAERDRHLLNEEMSHRLKNNLAMVQAIAKQTLRGVQDRSAVDALNQRLVALGTAHDVLLQQRWKAAPIRTVVENVLALHADPTRFALRGPNLRLGARTVLSMSMVLHELATNAVKYGALSEEQGLVSVTWAVETDPSAATFSLIWEEAGGPAVAEPTTQGFGSRLIRLGLAGTGGTLLRYDPAGLRAEFRAPLNMISET